MLTQIQIFNRFFDESKYTSLFAQTAVAAAYGTVTGKPVYAVCQSGDAFSLTDCERMERVLRLAAKTGNPVVTFYHSVGIQLEKGLQEMQSARSLSQTIGEISGVVPQIAVVLGVCVGTAAIQAGNADLCLMAKQGQLFLVPPFLSGNEKSFDEQAGSAEFAERAGIAAAIYDTKEKAISAARDTVMLLPLNNLDSGSVLDYAGPQKPLDMDNYCRIRAGASLIDHNRDFELFAHYGSRNSYTALGTIQGKTVGVVATSDRFLEHESVTKITRFVRLCDTYNIPVVTLVHSKGFAKSSSEELAGGIREAARLASTFADATTPKIAIFAGTVYGAVYTALCNADITIAVEGCVVSPIEPKSMATILMGEQAQQATIQEIEQKAEEYAKQSCSAQAVLQAGLADMIADTNTLRTRVEEALRIVQTKRVHRLQKNTEIWLCKFCK